MKELLSKTNKSLIENKFVLFCGAGVSFNSGMPLANELKQQILEKLPIDKEYIDEILKSTFPFEALMETISENTDISKILDIFEDGKPNTNHILIAKLVKNGFLKTIYTTNFDLHIENAFKNEGLKSKEDFEVYYDEELFSQIDIEKMDDKKIRLFKIHGSIDNRASIRTTLKAVASKILSEKRRDLIKYIFLSGNHKKVLIIGYSCIYF
jgi:NAD-dependent SIR2 family protein deacetylase